MSANAQQIVPKIQAPLTRDICASVTEYQGEEHDQKIQRILKLMQESNASLIAHYYVQEDIQALAESSGGFVGDSLEMAHFGKQCASSTLIIAGVRFMGETAKILSPEKRVLMPTLKATCSLDEGCPIDRFDAFCNQHPEHTVVVYANTSAAVKARADWVVTSSIALKIISHLADQGQKILWAPDKHLGKYIQSMTGADMLLWEGSCVVHEEFKSQGLARLKQQHPDAAVLVHPESPAQVIEMADVVGSTSALINAVKTMGHQKFIVATDNGIFYKMQQVAPHKQLLEAPTAGEGATCKSCAHCPWMAMNGLDELEQTLLQCNNEIHIAEDIRLKALQSTMRMIEFSQSE